MEIILAFLVFFGGFTLGSITSEKEDASSQSTRINNDEDDRAKTHQTTQIPQTLYVKEVSTCHIAYTPIYRDLTRSYHGEFEQLAIENGDCEEGSSDE